MKTRKRILIIVPIIFVLLTSCSSKPKNPIVNLGGSVIGIKEDIYHDKYLIATLTFYDPETNWFAAAGHDLEQDTTNYNIYDMDVTGKELEENGIEYGLTAELNEQIGVCADNDYYGAYGYMTDGFVPYGESIPIARIDEIKKGPAVMYYTDEGHALKSCEIMITYIDYKSEINGLDMDFIIKDENFLKNYEVTMAGMSGSPIIQDGKLIGALSGCVLETKVCIATFAITMYENMLETSKNQNQ